MQNEECLERRMKMKEIKDDGDNDGRGQVRDKHIVKPETRRRQRTREKDRETEVARGHEYETIVRGKT